MRPPRRAAEAHTEAFIEVVRAAQKKGITLEQLGRAIGLDSKDLTSAMSKKVDAANFTEIQRKDALDYIYDTRKAFSETWRQDIKEFQDVLYFSLIDFFNVHETSRDNARTAFSGTYELWRHSIEDNPNYIHGKISFHADEKTDALRVEMTQRRQPSEGVRGGIETFSGYMVRVANVYMIILRDCGNNDPRITLLPYTREEPVDIASAQLSPGKVVTRVVEADGFVLGKDGGRLYFSPLFLSLVDDAQGLQALDAALDVTNKVADSVKRRLEKYPFLVM
jgi:hypothetical protein